MKERKLVRLADVRTMEFIPPRDHPENDVPRSVVMLDGNNISAVCFRAEEYDDGTLIADIYQRSSEGGFMLIENSVATSRLIGKGSITPR